MMSKEIPGRNVSSVSTNKTLSLNHINPGIPILILTLSPTTVRAFKQFQTQNKENYLFRQGYDLKAIKPVMAFKRATSEGVIVIVEQFFNHLVIAIHFQNHVG